MRPLYVETMIRADLDELWRLTQDPGQHQRWDLRFTRIEYLAPDGRSGPQRFRYSVGMLPGMWIAGTACALESDPGQTGREHPPYGSPHRSGCR